MTERLQRVPFFLITVLYSLYIAYQVYVFHFAPDGAQEIHKARVSALQVEIAAQDKKLVEGRKFLQTVELKKRDIQNQAKILESFQGAMSESLEVPSMIKLMVTEAKRSGLKVDKIEPGKRNIKEFYLEQEFKLTVRGSYAQVLVFFQHVSQLQRIMRVESYTLKPQFASPTLKNATLNAQFSLRAYQYIISKEDKIGVGAKK